MLMIGVVEQKGRKNEHILMHHNNSTGSDSDNSSDTEFNQSSSAEYGNQTRCGLAEGSGHQTGRFRHAERMLLFTSRLAKKTGDATG
jgi:chromosome condensin MukBEF MukE localization factor